MYCFVIDFIFINFYMQLYEERDGLEDVDSWVMLVCIGEGGCMGEYVGGGVWHVVWSDGGSARRDEAELAPRWQGFNRSVVIVIRASFYSLHRQHYQPGHLYCGCS